VVHSCKAAKRSWRYAREGMAVSVGSRHPNDAAFQLDWTKRCLVRCCRQLLQLPYWVRCLSPPIPVTPNACQASEAPH
jgi:hypothetical protein